MWSLFQYFCCASYFKNALKFVKHVQKHFLFRLGQKCTWALIVRYLRLLWVHLLSGVHHLLHGDNHILSGVNYWGWGPLRKYILKFVPRLPQMKLWRATIFKEPGTWKAFMEEHSQENTWVDDEGLIVQETALIIGRNIRIVGSVDYTGQSRSYTVIKKHSRKWEISSAQYSLYFKTVKLMSKLTLHKKKLLKLR